MDKIELAREIAVLCHAGQVDKGGYPYINHLKSVADLVVSENEKIVAWLHDVVEDTHMTLKGLAEFGFSDEIIEAVDAITMREGEDRESYLMRVASNRLATSVKIADLTNNSDISRINNPINEDYDRVNRYIIERRWLREIYVTQF